MQNFAAQAVIAIENARLLNELRQRTDDLSETLEQQRASSDVLRVISSSPGDLKPVFDAMLASATRICDATFGSMALCDGDACPSSNALRQSAVFGTEALARLGLRLGGFQLMLQSSQFDGVAFDPFSFQKDGLASAEVDVGRRQVL